MTCPACNATLAVVTVHGFACDGPPCACTSLDYVCTACLLTRAPAVRSGHQRIWRHFDLWQERKRVEVT